MPRLLCRSLLFLSVLLLVAGGAVHAADDAASSAPAADHALRVKAKTSAKQKHADKAEQKKQAADAPLKPTTDQVEVAAAKKGGVVGWLKLSGKLREGPVPFAWIAKSDMDPSLNDVVKQLRTVADGRRYKGVVIYLDRPQLRLTQIDAIRRAMHHVRDKGRKVLVFSDSYDLKGYLLASAGDMILLQHKGDVELNGLEIQEIYLAGLLKKIGLKADLVQIGKYKGADEPLTRTGPSKAWSKNINGLLDDLYKQMIDPIAKDRSMSADDFEKLMEKSWTLSDSGYLKQHLVDGLVSRDLTKVTDAEFGDDFVWDDSMGVAQGKAAKLDNPFALLRVLFHKPEHRTRRTSIAVINADGVITSGDSRRGVGILGESSIGSRTLVKALGEARDDDKIKGVVIALDSPGGSALASEVIWQAVRALGQTKPVFASVGPMAASGGYYIASATDQIYVAPGSIVGSIGVVGGKIVMGDLFKKLGIHVKRRSRGPLADMFNVIEPFTKSQRKIVRASMKRVYEQFKKRVKLGRGKRLKKLAPVAAGRVFTGRQAVKNGMADTIGDQRQAMLAMADKLKLKQGEYDVVHLPGPMSLSEFLDSLFGVHGRPGHVAAPLGEAASLAPALVVAKQLLGPQAWDSVRTVLAGLMQLRAEPVLCVMPYAVIVK